MSDLVKIVGSNAGPEYEAARLIGKALEPVLDTGDRVTLVVGFKCLGQPRQDIDLILLGSFRRGLRFFDPKVGTILLRDLALIIEYKQHSGSSVRFQAGHVKVKYREEGWHDATDQVFEQLNSLRKFLRREDLSPPHFGTAIWLPNVSRDSVQGDAPRDVILGEFSVEKLTSLAASVLENRIRETQAGEKHLACSWDKGSDLNEVASLATYIGRSLQPTPLDRRRLERVSRRLIDEQQYVSELGDQLLEFRGRGGSGKTVHLIRLANGLYNDLGKRVLLLTYNHALVSDIKRLFTLQGIADRVNESGIHIQTAESFFVNIIRHFGGWDHASAERSYEDYYPRQKALLLELLRGTGREEARTELVNAEYRDFGWDFILIDEAQDWPADERDILYMIYGPTRCVVADGVDQLVRNDSPCNWGGSALVARRHAVPLKKSLRLKSNLCRFVRDFADEVNLDWDQEPNDELGGGRVLLVDGDYTREIHDSVMASHKEAGNAEVDSLICVPPSRAAGREDAFGPVLRRWGLRAWDATDRAVRSEYPVDNSLHRIVTYESCRGLEGWTVVCLGIEEFFGNKVKFAEAERQKSMLQTEEDMRRAAAFRWTLIPLTRAIDTIVLQVEPSGELSDIIRAVGRRCSDFVETIPA